MANFSYEQQVELYAFWGLKNVKHNRKGRRSVAFSFLPFVASCSNPVMS